MKALLKNKFFSILSLYIIFLIVGILISKSLNYTMPDDGWRHLAMALYPETVKSWGNIYPYSLYEEFDPWFMWHKLLQFINSFVNSSNIHIAVNSIIYSLLSLWYYLAFNKFTNINKFYSTILALGLPILNFRYFFLRPDVLSGLFVLYFIINKNKFFLILISSLYAPFYYIFWFYFGYLSYINIILKKYYKVFILIFSIILGFSFYLIYDLKGYLKITFNVLNNDNLRQTYSVGESKSIIFSDSLINIYGSSSILIFLILISLLTLYAFKPKDLLTKYIILLSPLLLIQYRFLFILQPLIYLFSIHIIYNTYKIIQVNSLEYFIEMLKKFLKEKTYFYKLPKNTFNLIFLILVISFFTFEFIKRKESSIQIEKNLNNLSFLKNDEFKNKKILFSSMSISSYMATYLNPSSKYIPNCSLGWVKYSDKNKKTYFNLLINNDKIKMDDFFYFINSLSPDYLIIDTSITSNLNFDHSQLDKNSYRFYKIINSKLILRKIQ